MTNDIGGYQANHSEMKAGAAISVRGAIRHTNFYCTAISQLVMDRRQRNFATAFSSSAYVLRSIEDIVQNYSAGNRTNSAVYLKKRFKHDVEDVVARLQELTLEMWLSDLRLESLLSVHLEHCCSWRKKHWMMRISFFCEAVATLLGTSPCFSNCTRIFWIAVTPIASPRT
jgi:hypothetical protein